jgi:hypothetical protein
MRPKTDRELRQSALMKTLLQRSNVIPAVCESDGDPLDRRFAIRDVTLDDAGIVVDVSRWTRSPKAGSSEELRQLIAQLIEQAELSDTTCGHPPQRVSKQTLEEFELLVGLPVFRFCA